MRLSTCLDDLEKRKISCPAWLRTQDRPCPAYGRLLYCATLIHLNVGTHCLWFKMQRLEHAQYKSITIYLVQAASLIPLISSSRRLHVWHKTVKIMPTLVTVGPASSRAPSSALSLSHNMRALQHTLKLPLFRLFQGQLAYFAW